MSGKNIVKPGNEPRKKIVSTRKRKREMYKKADFINKCQIPLSNKFEALNEIADDEMEGKNEVKKVKISPIVVTTPNIDIQKIAENVNVQFVMRIMSIGKKVFVESMEDKTKLIEALKANKIDHFSHPDDVDKTYKIILSGLPECDTNSIIDELKTKHEITPTKVTMFITKSVNKLYLCEFNKNEVNNKKLNGIQSINQHIIKWQLYKPKRRGPTQCRKCLMYGHGISSCARFTVCALCCGSHLTSTCTTFPDTIENPIFRCFNCASSDLPHNHKATDPICPFRTKYNTTISSMREKSKQNKKQNPNVNNHHQSTHRYVLAPPPAPLTASYAYTAALTNAQPSAPTSLAQTFMPNFNGHINTNTNQNLWSFTEVSNLLLNSINELKQCKSKLDQLAVIAKLLQNATTD